MDEEPTPQGELHHFQLVNADGNVPFSITVLVHYNRPNFIDAELSPISANDIIDLHEALQTFDGDYKKAFKQI